MAKKVHVIINPASGQPQPILHTLNSVFHPAGIDWGITLTKKSGDAQRAAHKAAKAGVDIVAAYGGDGTMMEVSQGLMDSDIPLAILPGGTANLVSVELNIPKDLKQAAELIVNKNTDIKKVDMGKIRDDYFLLRVGLGIAAEKVKKADREMKDKYGLAAYSIAALQAMSEAKPAHYKFTLDGKVVEADGVTCLVDNAGNLGMPGFKAANNITMWDGLLDLILVADLGVGSLAATAQSVLGMETPPDKIQHWQAKKITIETEKPMIVNVDGEMKGTTPLTIGVVPGAVSVITPAQ
jgi:YegS/Rv2252/BmrU family lipid kinase